MDKIELVSIFTFGKLNKNNTDPFKHVHDGTGGGRSVAVILSVVLIQYFQQVSYKIYLKNMFSGFNFISLKIPSNCKTIQSLTSGIKFGLRY